MMARARLFGDLLDVSRIEARRLTVESEPVRLAPLISEAVDLAPEVAKRCHTEIARDAERAWADSGRIVQVLSNLLSNAYKYSEPDTPIEVHAEPIGDMVQVSVTNEGPGIAPDEIPKLFSRFSRTRSAHMSDGISTMRS